MKTSYLSYLLWISWSRDLDPSQDTGSEANLRDSGDFISHSPHIPIDINHSSNNVTLMPIVLLSLDPSVPSSPPLWLLPLDRWQRVLVQLHAGHTGQVYKRYRCLRAGKGPGPIATHNGQCILENNPGYLHTFTPTHSSATHVGSHATIELARLHGYPSFSSFLWAAE